MHVSTHAHSSCECTTPGRSLSLRGFACRGQSDAAEGPSEHSHDSPPPQFASPAKGLVCDSCTPHLKDSSVHDCVSSNKRHRETTRLFSDITQKSLPILRAPDLDMNASGHLKASFPINIHMDHTDEQEREMIGSEIALDLSH